MERTRVTEAAGHRPFALFRKRKVLHGEQSGRCHLALRNQPEDGRTALCEQETLAG